MKKISLFIFIVILSMTLLACSNENDSLDDKGSNSNQEELLNLTIEQVAAFDGKNGNLAYIVVQGVIYDVTEQWVNGEHNGVFAGTDATDQIMSAPHGESVLADLEIVGNIVLDEDLTVYFTLEELSAFDGKDGNLAYIAVDGIIYDVTDEWDSSTHNGAVAGTDVTSVFAVSPHSQSILNSLEIIGELRD
jgi:predicted heme/steroid binding protein